MPTDPWWPWRGLRWWLARPRLWLRPIVLMLLVLSLALVAAIGVGTWMWPEAALTGWAWWWRSGVAVALALATALAVWSTILPAAMALILDELVVAVRRDQGLPVVQSGVTASVHAAVVVLLRALPSRLLWFGLALAAGLLGPPGMLVAWFATARCAVLDAFDTALSVENVHPDWRRAGLRQHHGDLLAATLGVLPLVAIPVLGWLVLPPALVCGAALRRCSIEIAKP